MFKLTKYFHDIVLLLQVYNVLARQAAYSLMHYLPNRRKSDSFGWMDAMTLMNPELFFSTFSPSQYLTFFIFQVENPFTIRITNTKKKKYSLTFVHFLDTPSIGLEKLCLGDREEEVAVGRHRLLNVIVILSCACFFQLNALSLSVLCLLLWSLLNGLQICHDSRRHRHVVCYQKATACFSSERPNWYQLLVLQATEQKGSKMAGQFPGSTAAYMFMHVYAQRQTDIQRETKLVCLE